MLSFHIHSIAVTHDQAEAMTMSDRIAVLNEGHLQQIAPPLTCYNEPANRFVAGFIGSPSMNFVEGTVDSGSVETEHFSIDVADGHLDGITSADATLDIRPEDVYPIRQATELLMSVDPDSEIAEDEVLDVVTDRTNLHLFDGVSGEAVAHGVAVGPESAATTTEESAASDD
jgi:multiple sugar transport system ATP-binding protein